MDERIAEGFEIEGGVVGVREVAAPEAEVDFILADADAGVERKVKVLGDVVVFGPEYLAGAVQLGRGVELVKPFSPERKVVLEAEAGGVARRIGHVIAGKVLLPIVVVTKGGVREAIVEVGRQTGNQYLPDGSSL